MLMVMILESDDDDDDNHDDVACRFVRLIWLWPQALKYVIMMITMMMIVNCHNDDHDQYGFVNCHRHNDEHEE